MKLQAKLKMFFAAILDEVERNPVFAKRIEESLNGLGVVESEEKRPHRRRPGAFDPFLSFQSSEERLREQLNALDIEQLKDIIAENAMDRSKLAMKWKARERLVEHIIATVASRSRKGDAFRSASSLEERSIQRAPGSIDVKQLVRDYRVQNPAAQFRDAKRHVDLAFANDSELRKSFLGEWLDADAKQQGGST